MVPIVTSADVPIYRQRVAPLCAAPVLYNPHSRELRLAPRFSPTPFIPPVATSAIPLELDCLYALGIKGYTLCEEN